MGIKTCHRPSWSRGLGCWRTEEPSANTPILPHPRPKGRRYACARLVNVRHGPRLSDFKNIELKMQFLHTSATFPLPRYPN